MLTVVHFSIISKKNFDDYFGFFTKKDKINEEYLCIKNKVDNAIVEKYHTSNNIFMGSNVDIFAKKYFVHFLSDEHSDYEEENKGLDDYSYVVTTCVANKNNEIEYHRLDVNKFTCISTPGQLINKEIFAKFYPGILISDLNLYTRYEIVLDTDENIGEVYGKNIKDAAIEACQKVVLYHKNNNYDMGRELEFVLMWRSNDNNTRCAHFMAKKTKSGGYCI